MRMEPEDPPLSCECFGQKICEECFSVFLNDRKVIYEQHEALKAKVREIVRIAKCTDGECSNEAYMKMWAELEEVVK